MIVAAVGLGRRIVLAWASIPAALRVLRWIAPTLFVAAFVLLTAFSPARAQSTSRSPNWSPEVKQLFERGLAAARQQQWQGAINVLLKANWLSDADAAPIIFNLALAHDKAGGEVAAVCYFNMYLHLDSQAANSDMVRSEIGRLRREQKIKTQKVLDQAIHYVEKDTRSFAPGILAKIANAMGEPSKVDEIDRRYGSHIDLDSRPSTPVQALLPTNIWRRDNRRADDSGCENLLSLTNLPRWAYAAAPMTGESEKDAPRCEIDQDFVHCYPGGFDAMLEKVLKVAANAGIINVEHSGHTDIDFLADILKALELDTETLDGLALGTPRLSTPTAPTPSDPRSLDRGWGQHEADYSPCRPSRTLWDPLADTTGLKDPAFHNRDGLLGPIPCG